MTSPKVLAVATFGLTVVAVVGLALDGPRTAYFPAATALVSGLSIYLQIRHRRTPKHWTTRRVIDTTAFFVLLVAFVVGGFLVTRPVNPVPWTMPVTALVIMATMPFSFVGLVRETSQIPKPLRAPTTNATTAQTPQPDSQDERPATGEGRPG